MTARAVTQTTNDSGAGGPAPTPSVERNKPSCKQRKGSLNMTIFADTTPATKAGSSQGEASLLATPNRLAAITIDDIFDAPVETLLSRYAVTIHELETADRRFYGAAKIVSGRIFLLMPPNQSEFERDFFTRYLICRALDVDMTPLPEPFTAKVMLP